MTTMMMTITATNAITKTDRKTSPRECIRGPRVFQCGLARGLVADGVGRLRSGCDTVAIEPFAGAAA